MEVAELQAWVRPSSLAADRALPVLPGLSGLFPDGLSRGTLVSVPPTGAGATSLLFALMAGPTSAGSWAAMIGMPDIGPAAAAETGVDLGRLALVPDAGDRWGTVAAALVDAVDMVVVRPPGGVRASEGRQLTARARRRGTVVVIAGQRWPEAFDLVLSVDPVAWWGLEEGHGHLERRLVEVTARGRRGADRPHRARVWMPAAEGGVAAVELSAASHECAAAFPDGVDSIAG